MIEISTTTLWLTIGVLAFLSFLSATAIGWILSTSARIRNLQEELDCWRASARSYRQSTIELAKLAKAERLEDYERVELSKAEPVFAEELRDDQAEAALETEMRSEEAERKLREWLEEKEEDRERILSREEVAISSRAPIVFDDF